MRNPSVTAYCAACDVQVSGGRAGVTHVQGPDGRIYCEECGDAMRRMERMHVPEGAVTKSSRPSSNPNLKAASGSRKAVPPAKARPGPQPKGKPASEPPPHRARMIAAGIGLLVLAGLAAWLSRGAEPAREDGKPPANVSRTAPPAAIEAAQPPIPDPPRPNGELTDKLGRLSTPPPSVGEKKVESKPSPPAAAALSADDAAALAAAEGKSCTVEGRVALVETANSGKVTRIRFGAGKDAFEAVVFAGSAEAFGDTLAGLEGHTVRVSGRLSRYQGRLQIVLDQPSQLEVR